MRGNKHTIRISHTQFQKLQRNILQPKNEKKVSASKRCKGRENESNDKCFVFITFYISDNRGRDLDGMAATVLDCLVKAGKLRDDKRQIAGRQYYDYEVCEKGKEGFRVRIVTNKGAIG